MNYINNLSNMCCTGFGDSDTIRVERRTVLVDAVSDKICELTDVKPGHSYDCEERWALIKSYRHAVRRDAGRHAHDRNGCNRQQRRSHVHGRFGGVRRGFEWQISDLIPASWPST